MPAKRYEVFRIEKRKVKPNAHFSFQLNYYSVPHVYANQEITVKSNDSLLRIYHGLEQIAVHPIEKHQKGIYVTIEGHKPPEKQKKSEKYYIDKAEHTGPHVLAFLIALKQYKPFSWQKSIMGIFNLSDHYTAPVVDMACKRAMFYGAYSYQSVKNICSKGLYQKPAETLSVKGQNGFKHDLGIYDKLSN